MAEHCTVQGGWKEEGWQSIALAFGGGWVRGCRVGGKRKGHTGAGGRGSSPEEDMGVDKKEEEMLTGRESREGWKAGRGK